MIDLDGDDVEELLLDACEREGVTPRQLVAEGGAAIVRRRLRRSRLAGEVEGLRADLRRFGELLQQRVQPSSPPWLTAQQAAQRLGMTRKALYSFVERHPTHPVAQAASRRGSRLLFSREGLDAAVRASRLRSRPRGGAMAPRVPSPGKESGRW